MNEIDKKNIVVKIGSSILVSDENRISEARLKSMTSQISQMKKLGINVVIVSSGAIACGMNVLRYSERPKKLEELQAVAAIGQSQLMHEYEKAFREYQILTAQILLTPDGMNQRNRYLNARNTILNLLEKGVVPVVNENDTVATDEICFGDNDKLSAVVASLIDADLLIVLSDVDGVYDKNGDVIRSIKSIDDLESVGVSNTTRATSVGGMVTKLEAGKIASHSGIPMIIANGNKSNILLDVFSENGMYTTILPQDNIISGKKRWIAFSCLGCGKIIVDDGARDALLIRKKSLLASGIISVAGNFSAGDLVVVCDSSDKEIARGLTNYSRDEVEKMKGIKTAQIESVLGYKSYDEVIHRNNLAVIG